MKTFILRKPVTYIKWCKRCGKPVLRLKPSDNARKFCKFCSKQNLQKRDVKHMTDM